MRKSIYKNAMRKISLQSIGKRGSEIPISVSLFMINNCAEWKSDRKITRLSMSAKVPMTTTSPTMMAKFDRTLTPSIRKVRKSGAYWRRISKMNMLMMLRRTTRFTHVNTSKRNRRNPIFSRICAWASVSNLTLYRAYVSRIKGISSIVRAYPIIRNGRGSVFPICVSDALAMDSGSVTPMLGKSSVIDEIAPETLNGVVMP